MAKFKLGDKVTDGNAVYEITGIDNGFGSYEWKLVSGRADPSHSEGGDFGWADSKMKIVNAAVNAKFKVGDRVYYKGKVGVVERANSKFWYDILVDDELLTDVDVRLLKAANSRACNAKFKVGDKVWVPAKQKRGVIRGVSATGNQYDVEFMGGGGAYVNEEGLEFLQALGNSDAPVSANSVVRNAMAANVRTARNADVDADKDKLFKGEIDRISARITSELKNQAENYAYWINRNCGNDVDYLFENIEKHKDELSPSIIAEAKKLRKRVDDAIAASKRLPR